MTSPRTIHARLHKAGLVPVKDTWLTPAQAARVKAWDDQNRKAAEVARNTHKEARQ